MHKHYLILYFRQIKLIESGGKVVFNTMTFNAKEKTTSATRSKEEAHDYRYFPEPDLVKVTVTEEWKQKIMESLPEFPDARCSRFMKEYSLPFSDSDEITQDKFFADYFEEAVNGLKSKDETSYRTVSNIVRAEVRRVLNEQKINIKEFNIPGKIISMIADSVAAGKVSVTASKEMFNTLLKGNSEEEMISLFNKAESDLSQISDSNEIESVVMKILDENPKEVQRYKGGEKKLAGFFVGKIMQESHGKANPKIVNELLLKNLETE